MGHYRVAAGFIPHDRDEPGTARWLDTLAPHTLVQAKTIAGTQKYGRAGTGGAARGRSPDRARDL